MKVFRLCKVCERIREFIVIDVEGSDTKYIRCASCGSYTNLEEKGG